MRGPFARALARVRVAALALVVTAGPATVSAQETAPVDVTSPLVRELLSCPDVEDDQERLACFDRTAAALSQAAEQGSEDEPIKVQRGQGDWNSEELVLKEPWRVAWTSEGSILTIELQDSVGQFEGVVGNQIGAGEGMSDVLAPGSWQLAVRAVGEWEVRVLREPQD